MKGIKANAKRVICILEMLVRFFIYKRRASQVALFGTTLLTDLLTFIYEHTNVIFNFPLFIIIIIFSTVVCA